MFVAYQGVTKRKKTIEILRRARDAAPSDVRSYLGLASLFMQTGKTKKAAKVIQSAVKALAKRADKTHPEKPVRSTAASSRRATSQFL